MFVARTHFLPGESLNRSEFFARVAGGGNASFRFLRPACFRMSDSQALREAFGPYAGLPEREWGAFAEALRRFPPPCVRVRPDASQATVDWLDNAPAVPWHPRGRLVAATTRPTRTPFYGAGEWYVQDAGSLLADALLDVVPGESVLDLCASPGGKSTAIAERLGGTGVLVANEPVAGRLDPLRFNLARHGSFRHVVTSADPEALAGRYPAQFDAVLVDAPCSGQSLVVRGKQGLSAFGSAAVEMNAERQTRILNAAAKLVRPGGRLVYATCTFAPQENEDQVATFLDRHPGWALEPRTGFEGFESEVHPGTYRLLPHRHPTAGAFAACLRRSDAAAADQEASSGDRPQTSDRKRLRDRSPAGMTRAAEAEAREALAGFVDVGDVRLVARGPSVFAFPADFPHEFEELLVGGPEALFLKGKTWFPSYALAMRRDASMKPRTTIEADEEDARRYLRGESFASSATGWAVVTRQGLALGWCKADGRQAKNHLPKPGRLGDSNPSE
jgi:16S rRNA C967 or C1407 C5-methylase (RsmB/RsmF family)